MGENIHLEKHVADGVAVIRLDRPKVNALSSDMMRDLHAICDELAVDDTTRAVVVTGGRKNFAAGADISETNTFSGTTIAQEDYALDAPAVWDINLEGAKLARAAADLH